MFVLASLLVLADVWLPVYSHERSSAQLHVQSFAWDSEKNCIDDLNAKTWTFPAEYTGKRSLCHLPGATNATGFIAWVGGDTYSVGNPFGFTPAASAGNVQAIDLTRTAAASSRISLWADASDRKAWFGVDAPLPSYTWTSGIGETNEMNIVTLPTTDRVRVRVMRLNVDGWPVADLNKPCRVFLDRVFDRSERGFICEGDLLGGNAFDFDWENLVTDLDSMPSYIHVTNVEYAVVFGDGAMRSPTNPYTPIKAHPLVISRRFEKTHTPPTAVGITGGAHPTFNFRIDGEDTWASKFGSTYTAFRVVVYPDERFSTNYSSTYFEDESLLLYAETNATAKIALVGDAAAATNAVTSTANALTQYASYVDYVASACAACSITNAQNAVAAAQVTAASNQLNNARWYLNQRRYSDVATYCGKALDKMIEARATAAAVFMPFDSGIQRMPPKQNDGGYRWTAAAAYTNRTDWAVWQVFTYNSKFKSTEWYAGSQAKLVQ